MSDCKHGGRDVYDGIHGAIHWKDHDRDTPLSYARFVNGVERIAKSIELDGVEFYPADFELLEIFEDGKRVAVELDGVRYVREMTDSNAILLPCPFCGGGAKAVKR